MAVIFIYVSSHYENNSQSASLLKVIEKLTLVLSQSAPIRSSERPVWASSLPDYSTMLMAVVKREISCLNLFGIVACTCCQHNMDRWECRRWRFYQLLFCAKNMNKLIICYLQHQLNCMRQVASIRTRLNGPIWWEAWVLEAPLMSVGNILHLHERNFF